MKEREIKFRAWDTESKEMEDDVWGTWNAVANGDGVNVYMDEARRFYKKVIMQFTGLVDCNGVDIYEGDILGLVYGGHVRGEVSWHEQVGAWSWEHGIEWGMIEPSDVEVIGNIYENPDRLDK